MSWQEHLVARWVGREETRTPHTSCPGAPRLGAPCPSPCSTPGAVVSGAPAPLLPSPSPAQPAQPWEAPRVVPSLPETAEGPGQGSRGGGRSGALVSSSVKWDCNDPAAELRDDGRGAPGEEAEVLPQARRKSCPGRPPQPPAWPPGACLGGCREDTGPGVLPGLCSVNGRPWPSPSPSPSPAQNRSFPGALHQAPEHQPPPLETSGEPHLKAKVLWGNRAKPSR